MTRTVAEFLRAAVLGRQNILISGGTGTGKTTLLNCLSRFHPATTSGSSPSRTRPNCSWPEEHVVRLETRPANIEGHGRDTRSATS